MLQCVAQLDWIHSDVSNDAFTNVTCMFHKTHMICSTGAKIGVSKVMRFIHMCVVIY